MRVRAGGSNIGIILLTAFATVALIAAAAAAGYFYLQNQRLKKDIAEYAELEEKYKDLKAESPRFVAGLNEAEGLIKQIDKLAVLPGSEVPTLVPVDDVEKIKNIDFFKSAKTGDVVLVYPQAKFAVLYRPSEYKIIMMGPQTFSLGTR